MLQMILNFIHSHSCTKNGWKLGLFRLGRDSDQSWWWYQKLYNP